MSKCAESIGVKAMDTACASDDLCRSKEEEEEEDVRGIVSSENSYF